MNFNFVSVNARDHVLRHQNFLGELTALDNGYLRHRDFHLFLEAPSGPEDQQFHADATFTRRGAAQLID